MAKSQDKYKTIKGIPHKLCSTKKHYVPMDEVHFSSRSSSPDGFSYSCKECERETSKRSYDKKRQREKARKRYQENKEVLNERQKQRYRENKEAYLENGKKYRQTAKGRAVVNAASQVRRDRIKAQTPEGSKYTERDVIQKSTLLGECVCGVCNMAVEVDDRASWHVDHIIPIAAGGADTLENVQIAHQTCNLTRPKNGSDI